LVVSQELARMGVPQATALIGRELRNAIAVATDAQFLSVITAGVSRIPASGSTSQAVLFDLYTTLLQNMTTGNGSKLFIVTTPKICKTWACLGSSSVIGSQAFPEMTPTGGRIIGIPVISSDGVAAGDVLLIDASGVVAGSGDLILSEFADGIFQSDTTPDSPVTGATNLMSLWQLNLTAICLERWFVCSKLRADCVGAITGSYGAGFSPASLG
jgi:hypothetical protein